MINTSPKKRYSVLGNYAGPTQPIPKKSLQIRTDKPRPHVCNICTRGFARLEHLKRHERSHTNEKPFQCALCGRCFARRDLVLRHQQKLHLHSSPVVRRGLVPAAASDLAALTPTNDNIIVLHNNTSNKAPLPNTLQEPLPAAMHSLPLVLSTLSPQEPDFMSNLFKSFNYGASTSATMPSPSTNSNHNTPSGMLKGAPRSATDHDTNFTQQPSPLNGDSPEQKEKRKSEPYYNFAERRESHMTDFSDNIPPSHTTARANSVAVTGLNAFGEPAAKFKGFAHFNEPRHASFSAVSGLSYTNVKDAIFIQNGQIADVPTQVGFATPQLTAAELDSKGLLMLDFNTFDLDWYNMDFKDDALRDQSIAGSATANGFKMKLNTIPSESQIMKPDSEKSFYPMTHQFLDPNHPHHIKGTTPIDFSLAHGGDLNAPYDVKNSPKGTGLVHLASELFDLEENRAGKVNEKAKPSAGPVPKRNMTSSANLKDVKRTKLGFVNDVDNLEWVEQIKGVPVTSVFPCATHNTGFLGMPYIADQFESDEVFLLFKFRQDDLVRQRSQVDTHALNSGSPNGSERLNASLTRRTSKVKFTIGEQQDFITDELRNRIVTISKLTDEQFPPLEDLNSYMNLYEKEFNSYFLFIHMPTLKNPMVDNFENIPLILSMCAIGALYSYHDSNTLLLFNLSKYHIHNFFEKEVTVDKLQFKKVPIMAHQSLVLHIFISMFLNEPNMVEITSRQMNSMVGLIKSTNFHKPLEQFLIPPPNVSNPNDLVVMQNNFDYFIMTQTRIRTIHTFYQLEVFRSALLGTPLPMGGADIMCGTHCNDEELWKAGTAREWYEQSLKSESKSLVELSNNESMHTLFEQLSNASFSDAKTTLNKSFALLMHVHEQILVEYISHRTEKEFNPLSWRVNHRPKVESLLKSWEGHFSRNGGFSVVNNHNHHLLNSSSELKLILPLLSFANIRLCVNITPTMERVLYKDWNGMEETLNAWECDFDALKEASQHATDILSLWVHNILVLNNAKQTSVRTPVFFVSCVFIAFVVLAKTLQVIEHTTNLTVSDRAFWLRCEKVLRSIETMLSPNDESNSYSEFLRQHSHGVFDYAWSPEFKQRIQNAVMGLNSGRNEDAAIRSSQLLMQALSLGIKTLADAPLWPLAMGFAEALKNMAVQMSSGASVLN